MSNSIDIICCNNCRHYGYGRNESYKNSDDWDMVFIYSEDQVGECTKGYKFGDCTCQDYHMDSNQLSVDVDLKDFLLVLGKLILTCAIGLGFTIMLMTMILGHCFK